MVISISYYSPFPYSFGSRVGYYSIRRYSVPFRFIASASSPHPNNYVCWPRNSSCGSWYLCRPATRFFVNWFPHYSHSSRYQRSTIRIIHAVNSFTISPTLQPHGVFVLVSHGEHQSRSLHPTPFAGCFVAIFSDSSGAF